MLRVCLVIGRELSPSADRAPSKGEQTRKRIIGAATHLFWSGGYNATSVDKVAMIAGANKATIYRYFASKEDLLRACIERTNSALKIFLNVRLDSKASADEIQSVFMEYCRDYGPSADQGYGFLLFNLLHELSPDEPQLFAPLIDALASLIRLLAALNSRETILPCLISNCAADRIALGRVASAD